MGMPLIGLFPGRPAAFVGAAFLGEVADQCIYRRVDGPADQRRGLPLLRDQACENEALKVMAQRRRRRDTHPLLKLSNRQTRVPGAHQRPVDPEAGGAPERLKLLGRLFDIHRIMVAHGASSVKPRLEQVGSRYGWKAGFEAADAACARSPYAVSLVLETEQRRDPRSKGINSLPKQWFELRVELLGNGVPDFVADSESHPTGYPSNFSFDPYK